MAAMNRCPRCHDTLQFVGVRATQNERDEAGQPVYPPRYRSWERWSQSPVCGLYVVTDEHGITINVTAEEPKKGYFNGEKERAAKAKPAALPVAA